MNENHYSYAKFIISVSCYKRKSHVKEKLKNLKNFFKKFFEKLSISEALFCLLELNDGIESKGIPLTHAPFPLMPPTLITCHHCRELPHSRGITSQPPHGAGNPCAHSFLAHGASNPNYSMVFKYICYFGAAYARAMLALSFPLLPDFLNYFTVGW